MRLSWAVCLYCFFGTVFTIVVASCRCCCCCYCYVVDNWWKHWAGRRKRLSRALFCYCFWHFFFIIVVVSCRYCCCYFVVDNWWKHWAEEEIILGSLFAVESSRKRLITRRRLLPRSNLLWKATYIGVTFFIVKILCRSFEKSMQLHFHKYVVDKIW